MHATVYGAAESADTGADSDTNSIADSDTNGIADAFTRHGNPHAGSTLVYGYWRY